MDPSAPGSPTPPAGRRFGRYVLLEAIDRGGMADVYRAVAHGPGGFQRQFVIKRIRKEKAASKEFVEMFVNEARISALLDHPNVVQVYDFGQVEGDYFLAMEYLRGKNLLQVARRLRGDGRELPAELAAYVGREVARGLHYSHTLSHAGKPLGIVHRDVTPSNIMLLRTGGVKLLDFGIARAAMKLRSITPAGGLIKGKLSYLSPEQVRGDAVDARSDIFSLGVVLWECLTGRRLFYNNNDLETMRAVLDRRIPRVSDICPNVPPALDAAVAQALHRPIDSRYQQAADMANDLEEYLRGCRFSAESLAGMLDGLFADEPSARELQLLPEDIARDSSLAGVRDDLRSPGGRLDAELAIDNLPQEPEHEPGYITVSSVHRIPDLTRGKRRRRWVSAAALAVVVGGVVAAVARPQLVDWLGVKNVPGASPTAALGEPPAAAASATAAAPAAPTAAAAVPGAPAAPPAPVVTAPPTVLIVQTDEPRSAPEPNSRGSRRERGSRSASVKGNGALTRGLDALAAGEYLRAVQELEASLKLSPLNHGALHALGEAEFQLGHHDRALASARRAVSLAPKVAGYRVLLGDILIKLHRYREAVDIYAVASSIAPANESIRERFARAKDKLAKQ